MAMVLFWNAQNCLNKRCFTSFRPSKLKTSYLPCQHPVREFQHQGKSKLTLRSSHGSQNSQNLLGWSRLWKPFVFTVAFTGGTFSVAAIAEHERIKKRLQRFFHSRPKAIKAGELREAINNFWYSISDSQKMFHFIAFLNCLVFVAWRIPHLQGFMKQYFMATPASKALCLPMLLSTFSHVGLWHIALNMYVLYVFVATAVPALGKEHFLAMYLSAGVFSNLMSYAYKIATKRVTPSVGASGSICGVLGYIMSQYPDLRFHIIFLPMFTFTSTETLYGILTVETIGLLSGLSFMDHAGHLGGLMFGTLWQKYGVPYVWPIRVHLLKLWEDLHENFRI